MAETVERVSARVFSFRVLLAIGWAFCCLQPASAQTASPERIAQGYLYIEPYSARFEALFDTRTVLEWLGSPGEASAVLDPAAQQDLQTKAAALAANWCGLRADGVAAEGKLGAVAIVKGEPGNTLPVKEGESAAVGECMVGLMWEFAIGPAPGHIEAQWWEFRQPVQSLPVRIFFGPLSESITLTRELPFTKWQNNDRLPHPRPLAEVPVIPPAGTIPIPVATIVWLFAGGVYYVLRQRTGRKPRGGWLGMVFAWLFGAAILVPMSIVRVPNPFTKPLTTVTSPAAATRIAEPLLRNIYRAFDFHGESQIYDTLARSVSGELLRTLYLETIQALSLEGREGARVRVSDLDVQIDGVQPAGESGFVADGQWTVLGTVGHWGHTHTRVNRYKARLGIDPVPAESAGREWKITGLEVLELRRL